MCKHQIVFELAATFVFGLSRLTAGSDRACKITFAIEVGSGCVMFLLMELKRLALNWAACLFQA